MCFAFGTDWRTLFDIVVLKARKPNFFVEAPPFFEVRPGRLPESSSLTGLQLVNHKASVVAAAKVEYGHVYNGGNAAQLAKDLSWNQDPAGVLYCGDEPVGDVMAPKLHHGWSTAAIVEELEALDNSLHFGDELDSACLHHTEQWGPFFYDCPEKANLSYWGALLAQSATVYLPCVSRFSRFPISHSYSTHRATIDESKDPSKLLSPLAIAQGSSGAPAAVPPIDLNAVTEWGQVLHAMEKRHAELQKSNIQRS